MYPITKAVTQYEFSAINRDIDTNENGDEYIYANDPKDGNDSSGEESRAPQTTGSMNASLATRLTKSAGPAVAYMRAQARRLHLEKVGLEGAGSDGEGDFNIPWRLIPEHLIEDLEFYKNAGSFYQHLQTMEIKFRFLGMLVAFKKPLKIKI